MSDIDFDELDKAVSTLMGDVPKDVAPETDAVKTLTINSTLSDDARPSFEKLDSTLAQVNTSVVTPEPVKEATIPQRPVAPAFAQRRSGRFMDVVHPSSTMKPAAKPNSPPSRVGATIVPSSDRTTAIESAETPQDVMTPAAYKDMTVSDVVPTATAVEPSDTTTTTNDWPDPLEMSGYQAEPATQTAIAQEPITPPVATDVASSEDQAAPYDQDESQPLASPFIADAKVEKRPLGAPVAAALVETSDDASVPDETTDISDDEETHSNEESTDTPKRYEAPLPPELQSDLIAIETDGDTSTSPVKVIETAEKQEVVPQTVATAVAAPRTAAVVSAPVAAGPTSIPQQYHEEPSTSDVSNGSIYDTDSYHQPLAHPAKAKSGWLIIIWILLLLIVGGGGAVALYFLGII